MQDKELSTKEKIKLAIETYNKYAKIYSEHTANKLLQFQLAKFVSLLPSKSKVLDAGCGCGRDAAYLKEDGLDVVAIDISPAIIEEAKLNNVIVVNGDLLKLNYKTEFDGIWCMATLADISKKDAPKLVKNFYNSLKDSGIMYIAVKEGDGENLVQKGLYENSPRFYALYKKEELENLIEDNGFNILSSTVTNDSGTIWLEVFARKTN